VSYRHYQDHIQKVDTRVKEMMQSIPSKVSDSDKPPKEKNPRKAGGARQIADYMMKLNVHLVERLLHMLQMNGGQLDEVVTMAPQRSNRTDLVDWPERST
jgi:hypothetical protein